MNPETVEYRYVIEKCEIDGFPTDYKLFVPTKVRDEYFIGRYKSIAAAKLAATSVYRTLERWRLDGPEMVHKPIYR